MRRATLSSALLVAALSAAAASVAAAQEPRPESASAIAELEAVTVTGKKREQVFRERISTFVSSVTAGSRAESLARWQVPVCPYVTGASTGQNEYLRQHVLEVARDAGASLAAADCGANLIVVLTADPEEVLRQWWGDEHRLFSTDRGVGGVERFLESEEPIRAWYNACDVSPSWAKSNPDRRDPPCGTGEMGTRLVWNAVRAIYSVIVVVDLGRIEGLNLGQVADYVAMTGLAHIRRDADLGMLPTILRLFTASGDSRPRGLSSWDKTFLRTLYETDATSFTQVSQVKSGMGQELGGSGPDPTAAVARLLAWINRVRPDSGRVVTYTEVGAYYEGPEGLRSALVNYEAELEFVADGYFAGERKAGERLQVYGDVEYIDEGNGWRLLRLAAYPR